MIALVIAFLFYSALLCIGIYLIKNSYQPFKENRAALQWDKVNGEVIEIYSNDKWHSLHAPIASTKEIQLAYEFEYRGIKYRRDTLDLDNEKIHITKRKNKSRSVMPDLSLYIECVRENPEVSIWVEPNNPNKTILKNIWRKHLVNILTGMTLIIWGLCTARLVMVNELGIGGIKLEEKIEVVEYLSKEEIQIKEAAQKAKDAAATQKGIEENLKWRKEQGLPID